MEILFSSNNILSKSKIKINACYSKISLGDIFQINYYYKNLVKMILPLGY